MKPKVSIERTIVKRAEISLSREEVCTALSMYLTRHYPEFRNMGLLGIDFSFMADDGVSSIDHVIAKAVRTTKDPK